MFNEKIIIISTCSGRKSASKGHSVDVANIPSGEQEAVLCSWKDALSRSSFINPVKDIYSGRSASEMKKISEDLQIPLYFISAGLGLVKSEDLRPHYDLTVSGNGNSSVLAKISKGVFSPTDWWSGINAPVKWPLSELVRKNSDSLIVCALSSNYFKMIRCDLEKLKYDDLKRVRIVGIKPDTSSPLNLSILPYDHRFNGEDSPIPGTLSDYAQRCAVHYIKCIGPNMNLEEDRIKILNKMKSLKYATRKSNLKFSDSDLIHKIVKNIEKIGTGKSKMLRFFRDSLGVACEQKRFSSLYDAAMKRIECEKN